MFDVNDEFTFYRSPGHPQTSFETDIEDKHLLPIANVLGAHTRMPTYGMGSPKDNENNHPIMHDGVYTIHNGTITNEDAIKKMFGETLIGTKFPLVDSIVISMLLSQIDPENAEEITEVMATLQGGFAINSVWKDIPNLSLLARGSGSPLVLAQHKTQEALFFGSEIESVWHMIRMMDLSPAEKEGWTYKSLDQGQFIVVYDGAPVTWGSFPWYQTSSTAVKLPYTMKRYLPKESKRDRTLVYETDRDYDYINKLENFSLLEAKTSPADLQYGRRFGAVDDKKDFPSTNGENEMFAAFCEADRIVKNGDLYHAFYGDIEVVYTNGRTVKDIFNHSLFNNGQRWEKRLKSNKKKGFNIPGPVYDWKNFYNGNKRTVSVPSIPKGIEEYTYIVLEQGAAEKKKRGGSGKVQIPFSQSGQNPIFPDIKDKKLVNPDVLLGWVDNDRGLRCIYENVWTHIHNDDLIFLTDLYCQEHKEKFVSHTHPYECRSLMNAASFTLAAFDHIDLFTFFKDMVLEYKMETDYCGKGNCYWADSEYVNVYSEKAYWEIITEEECVVCGTTRRIESLPIFIKHHVDASERIPRFVYSY